MEWIYLIALLPYIFIWLYIYRKSARVYKKEMMFVSILVAILSPITSYLYWNKDWWIPPSILSGYPVIPEDILLGFVFGGITAVIYEFCFHKKIKPGALPHKRSFWFLLFLLFLISAILFFSLNLNSFYSIIVSITFIGVSVAYIRKDLVKSSLLSGLLTLIMSIPFYVIIHFLSTDWALVTYKYEYLSGFTVYNFPIEEFIFWFFYGLLVGPAYEFIKGWKFK